MEEVKKADLVQDALGRMPQDQAEEKFNLKHNMLTIDNIYDILSQVCIEFILKSQTQRYFMRIL